MLKLIWAAGAIALVGCGGSTFDSSTDGGTSGGSGGSGTGGSSGAAAGGSGGAGAGGSGGAGAGGSGGAGAGGSGGTVSATECVSDSDCALQSDCCACTAYPAGDEAPPSCALDCAIERCSVEGVTEAVCQLGRCVAAHTCLPALAACDSKPPDCDPGMIASIVGSCYGPCVPVSSCTRVPSCQVCVGLDVCVVLSGEVAPNARCAPVPKGCEGDRSCGCLAPTYCTGGFNLCMDPEPNQIVCECPAC